MAFNPFERANRSAKASQIAITLLVAHVAAELRINAADVAKQLTPEQRRVVERAAGVRESSDETWELVIRLLTPKAFS